MEGKKMSAREQLAYLRGLIEGQNTAENAGISKFNEALLGVLEAVTEEIDTLAADQLDLREYVDYLEDELLSSDDDDDDDDDEDDCVFDVDDDDEDEEYERVVCPECEKDFMYQPDVYDEDEDLLCPHCGKPFKR
jgi:hypothetical protein